MHVAVVRRPRDDERLARERRVRAARTRRRARPARRRCVTVAFRGRRADAIRGPGQADGAQGNRGSFVVRRRHRARDTVYLVILAANRDPAVFAEPDTLRRDPRSEPAFRLRMGTAPLSRRCARTARSAHRVAPAVRTVPEAVLDGLRPLGRRPHRSRRVVGAGVDSMTEAGADIRPLPRPPRTGTPTDCASTRTTISGGGRRRTSMRSGARSGTSPVSNRHHPTGRQ